MNLCFHCRGTISNLGGETKIPHAIKKKKNSITHPFSQVFKMQIIKFPGGSDGKESVQHRRPRFAKSLGWEDPLEKRMAPHSSILAWRIPRTEEPGRQWS